MAAIRDARAKHLINRGVSYSPDMAHEPRYSGGVRILGRRVCDPQQRLGQFIGCVCVPKGVAGTGHYRPSERRIRLVRTAFEGAQISRKNEREECLGSVNLSGRAMKRVTSVRTG
jgi:hypothetical protein